MTDRQTKILESIVTVASRGGTFARFEIEPEEVKATMLLLVEEGYRVRLSSHLPWDDSDMDAIEVSW